MTNSQFVIFAAIILAAVIALGMQNERQRVRITNLSIEKVELQNQLTNDKEDMQRRLKAALADAEASKAAAALSKAACELLKDNNDKLKRESFTRDDIVETWEAAVDYGYTNAIVDTLFQKAYVIATQRDGKLVVWHETMSCADPSPPDNVPFVQPQTKKHK